MSRQAIAAVPATPPRYGLLVAANVVVDEERWQAGIEWAPENCAGGGAIGVDCFGSTPDMPVPDENPGIASADPFVVWGADKCSTIGWQARDYEGRARRMLEATQSFSVAREFWDGAITLADSLINTPLTDAAADTVTAAAGPVGIVEALGLLDGALGECGKGRRGMIHMTTQAFVHARAAYAVELAGQVWITPNGTVVVADAGYTGSGPNGEDPGATQWMYATSMVQVRLSPVDIIPGSLGEARAMREAMDNANTVRIRAQRLALVQWDQCCHLAAQVDIDAPLVGGAS